LRIKRNSRTDPNLGFDARRKFGRAETQISTVVKVVDNKDLQAITIDDRQLSTNFFFEKKDEPKMAREGKARFNKILANFLALAYRSRSLQIVDYDIDDRNVITGIFKGKGENYQFKVFPNGKIQYVEAEIRKDAEKDECERGKGCGSTCIAKGYVCRTTIPEALKQNFAIFTETVAHAKLNRWAIVGGMLAAVVALRALQKTTNPVSNTEPMALLPTSNTEPESKPMALLPTKKLSRRTTAIAAGGILAGGLLATGVAATAIHPSTTPTKQVKNPPDDELEQEQTISDDELKKKIEDYEDTIKDLPREKFAVISSKDGSILYESPEGEVDRVPIPVRVKPLIKGNIFTHNHPRADSPGLSFSNTDIKVASYFEAKEMRAVSPGYRHSIKPPPNGWNARFFNRVWNPAYEQNLANIVGDWQRKMSTGEATINEANEQAPHQVAEKTAKETGAIYTRVPIEGVTRESLFKKRTATKRSDATSDLTSSQMPELVAVSGDRLQGEKIPSSAQRQLAAVALVLLNRATAPFKVVSIRSIRTDGTKIQGQFVGSDRALYSFFLDPERERVAYKKVKSTGGRFATYSESRRADRRQRPSEPEGRPLDKTARSDGEAVSDLVIDDRQLSTNYTRVPIEGVTRESIYAQRTKKTPRTDTIARLKSHQFECEVGTPCKGICISAKKVCRTDIPLSNPEKERVKKVIEAATDKYSGRSIRELQTEAREKGIYRANHLPKDKLIETLKLLDKDPKSQENLRKTLEKRRKTRETALKILPKDLAKTWRALRTVSKAVGQNPDTAGLIAASALAGFTLAAAQRVKDRYKDGLNESAKTALDRAQKLPIEKTNKDNIMFAVGGYSGIGSHGDRIKELLEAPLDGTKGEKWFGKSHHIIPFNHSDFDIPTPNASKRDDRGRYNPLYLGHVAKESLGKYVTNVRRGRNEAAVELAAHLYAYGNRYPKSAINALAHGAGGNVVDEATEILRRMRKGTSKSSGEEIIKRFNIVRLGSPHFGFTNDKQWRDISHRTITSKNDPFSILPKRAAQWINSVKGGEIDDYLKSLDVRDRVREAFGYYGSSLHGTKRAAARRAETRKAIGEVLNEFSPGIGKLWNQVGKIQDRARENPTAAAIATGALVTGTSAIAYRRMVKKYQAELPTAASEAMEIAKTMRVDNPNRRNNVTFVVGGTGQNAQEIIDALPDGIKGTANPQGKIPGGKTHVVNTENGNYGINSVPLPQGIALYSKEYYAYLAANGFGNALKRNGGALLHLNKAIDPEAVRLAALLYAHGNRNFKTNKQNYQLNILAAGDGGIKARAAMEVLARMGPRGKKIADRVKLASFGTPGFGLVNDDPGTAGASKYVPQEVNYMGDKDFFRMFTRRGAAKVDVPGVRHKASEYLKNQTVLESLLSNFY
jgi:hypothetical protein